MHICIYISIYQLIYISSFLHIYQLICISVYLHINLSVYLSTIYICINFSIYVLIYQSIYLCTHLSVYLLMYVSISLSIYPPTPQYRKVMDHANMSSGLAFLDLTWPDSPPRRVYVRLIPDMNVALGRQFVLMCTGHAGPSYARTRLLNLVDSTSKDELVGGDYECNDGSGGAPILSGIVSNKVMLPCAEGLVSGKWHSSEASSTKFGITTKKHEGYVWVRVFGKVESGLEVVRAAAEVGDVGLVSVVDCGVVVMPR